MRGREEWPLRRGEREKEKKWSRTQRKERNLDRKTLSDGQRMREYMSMYSYKCLRASWFYSCEPFLSFFRSSFLPFSHLNIDEFRALMINRITIFSRLNESWQLSPMVVVSIKRWGKDQLMASLISRRERLGGKSSHCSVWTTCSFLVLDWSH